MQPCSRSAAVLAALVGLLLPAHALAVRPTSGGMWGFDSSDVVESYEEPSGLVRVHYSVEGPNLVAQADVDADGVPDFAQDVAVSAADVLIVYEDVVGLRAPISEAELGLGDLGGSPAFDFYLVDFGGSSDGLFGVDGCSTVPMHCSGFMVMENDFDGYGYPNLTEAVDVLTSHELFHAVQNAYDGEVPIWVAEGTAVWGERQYDPEALDYLWYADAYLTDVGRSLDKPPTGPVPTFAYATALWWDFLSTRHDPQLIEEYLTSLERTSSDAPDPLQALATVLESRGDSIEEAWSTFARWNLATGYRAGLAETYDYADRIGPIVAEDAGESIDDENRFYPLAASYYRLMHEGGPVHFGIDEAAPGLIFSLHPVVDGGNDGMVEDPIDTWEMDEMGVRPIAEGVDLAAGGYWLVGTYAALADSSARVRICLGDEEAASECAPMGDTGDTGGEEPGGCGCSGAPAPMGLMVWGLLLVGLRRRR